MRKMAGESHYSNGRTLKATSGLLNTGQEIEVPFPSRRQEARMNESRVCAYSLCESIEGGRVTIEQGEVFSLNRSEHGILVLMGSRPRNGQLLELHIAEARSEYVLSLYEVRWIKTIPVAPWGVLFLVGCRLVLGASRYWVF